MLHLTNYSDNKFSATIQPQVTPLGLRGPECHSPQGYVGTGRHLAQSTHKGDFNRRKRYDQNNLLIFKIIGEPRRMNPSGQIHD